MVKHLRCLGSVSVSQRDFWTWYKKLKISLLYKDKRKQSQILTLLVLTDIIYSLASKSLNLSGNEASFKVWENGVREHLNSLETVP